ncbi:Uncharacterised protein [Salmonella enterica subsp. enterica]|uniref:Uncharacterized protein n=1 Tax=Salmonella enterica I TaxID=59201 RepID=A0A447U3N5_SALET|nr:Uncharacterised protein [Salmonella enterica subsp. enterica]
MVDFCHLINHRGQSRRACGKKRQRNTVFTNRFQHGLSFAMSIDAGARVVVDQRNRDIRQQDSKSNAVRVAAEATNQPH